MPFLKENYEGEGHLLAKNNDDAAIRMQIYVVTLNINYTVEHARDIRSTLSSN